MKFPGTGNRLVWLESGTCLDRKLLCKNLLDFVGTFACLHLRCSARRLLIHMLETNLHATQLPTDGLLYAGFRLLGNSFVLVSLSKHAAFASTS